MLLYRENGRNLYIGTVEINTAIQIARQSAWEIIIKTPDATTKQHPEFLGFDKENQKGDKLYRCNAVIMCIWLGVPVKSTEI